MMRLQRSRTGGFTLLEVLVAIAIFAIVAALAYGGYGELTRQAERLSVSAERARAIQSAMQRLVSDFSTLEPRPVREPLGDSMMPALIADARNQQLAEFTRSSWANPAGVPRSTLQRVTYEFADGTLTRNYWVMLDRTLATEPVRTKLLDRVKSVQLRFMGPSRNFTEQWPGAGGPGPAGAARSLPRAVEVTLDLEDWGKVTRLIEVTG